MEIKFADKQIERFRYISVEASALLRDRDFPSRESRETREAHDMFVCHKLLPSLDRKVTHRLFFRFVAVYRSEIWCDDSLYRSCNQTPI